MTCVCVPRRTAYAADMAGTTGSCIMTNHHCRAVKWHDNLVAQDWVVQFVKLHVQRKSTSPVEGWGELGGVFCT